MRLIFVNRFYPPEEPATAQLLADLAEALAADGHAVTVITSQPAHPKVPADETRAGVRVMRVGSTRLGRQNLIGRVFDFATFSLGVGWRLFRTVRRGDLVVVMTDPPLLGLVAVPAAGLRGARCLHWVQDVFPEIAIALHRSWGMNAFAAALLLLRNLAWHHSAGCVAISEDMAAHIGRAGISTAQITVIPNWAPAGLARQAPGAPNQLRRAWGLEEKFVIAYSGNLGRVHDLEPVLELAAALQSDRRFAFVFIGDGAQRTALIRSAAARQLYNVHFHPAQPRDRLAETLAVGDVHLVTLRAGCEALVFPSKLYGIAAIGRPVVFIGPRECEVARLLTRHGFGLAFTRDEITAAAAALRDIVADPARRAQLGEQASKFSAATGRLEHALDAWNRRLTREAAC